MLTYLKNRIRFVMKFFAKYAHQIGCTPNTITMIGFVTAVASAILYSFRVNILLASVLYFLSGFFDVLDGAIASSFDETSVFGGFLDSLLDRYSDAIVMMGIIFGGYCNLSWGMAALVGTLLVSYARARGEVENITMASVGLAERAERILIILIASLLTLVYENALLMCIILLAIITHVTVLQRGYNVWKNTKTTER